jgi:hypothetical protein
MADFRAITAVGSAIVRVLEDARPASGVSNVEVLLGQAKDFPAPDSATTKMLVYLYRVEVSPSRRHLPPRILPDGRRRRPPLAIDLHYLLTPCASSAQVQQRLLGWCMRTLEDTATLPAGLLNGLGQGSDIFYEDETVELVCEPLSIQDLVNIFDPIKPNVYLSAGYVARTVGIESRETVSEHEPVQTREFRLGTMQ